MSLSVPPPLNSPLPLLTLLDSTDIITFSFSFLISPEQLAVPGDGAAVEFVGAGSEVSRVDDQHLPSRTGQGQLSAVTS